MRKNQKGFTLIELLVVIAIIGLLSTLAVVALTSARAKARDAKRISDIKQVQTALELYFADQGGKYPAVDPVKELGKDVTRLCSEGLIGATGDCTTTFMGKVPRDPSTPAAICAGGEAAGTTCGYSYDDSGTNQSSYKIFFALEGASGDLIKGGNCANPDGMKSGKDC